MVLPKNAEHACCIVSFFHFHEARVVLHYNGVKTNISPRVLHHAENIVNNPLLVRSKNRHSRLKGCSLSARPDTTWVCKPAFGDRGRRRTDTGVRCPREEDPRVPVARRRALVPTVYTWKWGKKNTHLEC